MYVCVCVWCEFNFIFFSICIPLRAALVNLRRCLEFTAQQHTLSHSLQASIKKRLLQPGTNTNDIITMYVMCVHTCACVCVECVIPLIYTYCLYLSTHTCTRA